MSPEGDGSFHSGSKVAITSDGFSLINFEHLPLINSGQAQDGTDSPSVIMQTVDCKICVNGNYMLNEDIYRIGYFAFKGLVL